MVRTACVWLAVAGTMTGCASPGPNPFGLAQSHVQVPGRTEPVISRLSDDERRLTVVTELPNGILRTLLYRDAHETWFRAAVHTTGTGDPILLTHRARRAGNASRTEPSALYLSRGWIGFDRPLPPDYRIDVLERVTRPGMAIPMLERSLLVDGSQEGRRFLEWIPKRDRALALEDDQGVDIEYQIRIQPGAGEVVADILLSPRCLSEAEWQQEERAREYTARLIHHQDSDSMRRFAALYVESASDYVEAYLPRSRRIHCYLQADLVRAWHRRVIAQYPELHRDIRMTGVRRSPHWQSSNLITRRDHQATGMYWRRNEGVVLDTWRADGGTATRIQTIPEFREALNVVRLEEEVR